MRLTLKEIKTDKSLSLNIKDYTSIRSERKNDVKYYVTVRFSHCQLNRITKVFARYISGVILIEVFNKKVCITEGWSTVWYDVAISSSFLKKL